jgi:hypothetical protein
VADPSKYHLSKYQKPALDVWVTACYNVSILFALHINLQYKLSRRWDDHRAGPHRVAADKE